MFDTIVALATPPFKSALAVIRMSGDSCFEIASKMLKKDLSTINKTTVLVCNIHGDKDIIDNVVCLIYKSPKSFTGEDVVEFICHGSMLIVNEIVSLSMKYGARQAQGGEFSQRAFLAKKIDLIQAEAIADVIDATTHEAKQLALMSLQGQTTQLFLPLKQKIEDLICDIEVHFDYPEEADSEEVSAIKLIKRVDDMLIDVNCLIDASHKGKIIKDGVNVALVGKPNVGKSSLLNALLNEDKAIVTPIAGTTRDVVEGEINLDGITLRLLDTAGIRQSEDEIETIGIQKSKQTIQKADLVIVVLDASKKIDDYDNEILEFTKDKLRLIVYNKSDISINGTQGLFVSAINKDIEPLKKEIFKTLGISSKDFATPSLANARQIGLLEQIKEGLLIIKKEAGEMVPIDLISVYLSSIYQKALELIGENPDYDISKEIFKRFCVGK